MKNNKHELFLRLKRMLKNEDEFFFKVKTIVEKKKQAELSKIPNRLSALALAPSNVEIENLAHKIVSTIHNQVLELRDKELDALDSENETLHDEIGGLLPLAQRGLNQSKTQSIIASNDRPIKNESGETLDDEIGKLKSNHPYEKPGELWVHLKTIIAEWSDSECIEIKPSKEKDSWLYQFKIGEKSDTITFGVFRKKLRQ